jgi:hypothetical protein
MGVKDTAEYIFSNFNSTIGTVRIILRGIFRKWEGIVGTGWSGLRIGTGGGHL